MDLLSAKIVAMVLMGSLALLFGLLPLKVKLMILKGEANSRKRKKRERIISGLLCFGSGVLLATVFIHMIPETREGFQRLQKLKSSNQPKAFNLHYNNSHNSTEDLEEHDFHDHYHDHYHHKKGENPIYHNHDHHNPSHDHENQNDTHDLDTTFENYNVTSKTNFGKNENHVHHHDHDHDNKNNNIIQPNDYHNISENEDHNHVHIQDHKISMKENHSHVHTPDHDHGHSHDHNEEGHDHVHYDNITELNDSDNISDNADHNHVHIPDHEISEKENHTHVQSPDHDHSHNHNHNKEHPHVHFDNVTKLNNNHNISENEDHNHIHMRDHEFPENGKHKHFHVPEHDHKGNHSSESDHDDLHRELEEDASHNSNSGSFLSTNDHISNFSNSEYENDPYNETHNHSVNNEQNERTTLTSLSVERDGKDNSENNKSYNSHEKQFHRTDVNSSRGLDNKSELSDHSHHDLSEFGSDIHSHHENENHDEHSNDDLSLSTPNEQSNVGSILEPVTEQNHNGKNNNNFMEKHKESGNKLILGKDIEKKDFDNDETIKENGPKFEALKQEASTTLSPKNNQHDEHGSTQSQHERNDHDAHEHDHNHDSQHDHEHGEEDHGYPMAELVFCLGFLLIYFIEEIVHKLLLKHSHHHHHHHHHHHVHHHHHSPSEDENNIEVGSVHTRVPSLRGYEDISLKDKESAINLPSITSNNNHKWEDKVNRDARMVTQGIDNPAFAADIDASSWNPALRNSVMLESNNQVVPTRVTNGNGVVIASNGISAASVHRPESTTQQKSKTSMKGICEHLLSNVGSLLIVIALSFHSIFEGLAVGLQEVQKDVWYLFLAISAHKFVIAFCIGLEFLEAGTPLVLYLLYMVGLALITPIGVGIGIIVTENETFGGIGHYYVITVLQGLAGGTLLYVALLEVLERERIKPGGRLIKIFCLALGFGVMASLEAVGGHSHGPAEGGQH